MSAITGEKDRYKYNLEVVQPKLTTLEERVVHAAKIAIDSGLFIEAGMHVAKLKSDCERVSVTAQLLDYIVFVHKENPLDVYRGTGTFLAHIRS